MILDDLDLAFSLVFSLFVGLAALMFLSGVTFFVYFAEITLLNCGLVFLGAVLISAVSGAIVYLREKRWWASTETLDPGSNNPQ